VIGSVDWEKEQERITYLAAVEELNRENDNLFNMIHNYGELNE
jgi:hypothetical protein